MIIGAMQALIQRFDLEADSFETQNRIGKLNQSGCFQIDMMVQKGVFFPPESIWNTELV